MMRTTGVGEYRVLLALLAAVALVAGIGVTGGLPGLQGSATHDAEPTTTWRVDVLGTGDARITITMRFRLATANETRGFRRLAREFENGETTVLAAAPFERAASLASGETNRSMTVGAVERTTAIENDTGRLVLSFTWTNFARVTDDRILIGDVFRSPSGTWLPGLTERQELVIDVPPQYAPANSIWPLRDGSVFIDGPVSFDPGQPSVTFEEVSPSVSVREATLEPDRIRVGESVDVTATVGNAGREAGNLTVELLVDGERRASREVTVGAESSETVTFTRKFDSTVTFEGVFKGVAAGTLTVEEPPANLSVRSATLDRDRVGPGESVTVRATVVNDGGVNGTLPLELAANGSVVETRAVAVGAGESRTVTLNRTFETPGRFRIAVNGVAAGTLSVEETTPPPPTTPSPTPPTTTSPNPPTASPTTPPPTTSPGPPDGGDATALAALLSLILVLAAFAYLVRRHEAGEAGGGSGDGDPDGPTAGSAPAEAAARGSPEGESGGDGGADAPLLSDEERVLTLLREHDGRMKQAAIVDATGWSNAKVSQLLSEMAEEGSVRKLRIGRENLITLPEEAPDGVE